MTKKNREFKIVSAPERPGLSWVGRKPFGFVRDFPAQLCEKVGVAQPPAEPDYASFCDSYNLLLHGDNKEVLPALLIGGFRGKVDLVYIDPPFDSGADYVRKVQLRGREEKLSGEEKSFLEQTQYEDMWAADGYYLQFMYERLILLRELLSDQGSIYLHCDWHKNHHLRCLMDEVFGEWNFVNEIVWNYVSGGIGNRKFAQKHDVIYMFSKGDNYIFNIQKERTTKEYSADKIETDEKGEFVWYIRPGTNSKVPDGVKSYLDKHVQDVWQIPIVNPQAKERCDYPTQKPEALLERIIKASSNKNSIVLDCFCGSGTTAAVAEKLGRRWIVADMNKGAIQTTMQRLNKIASEDGGKKRGFVHYRINNYDFAKDNDMRDIVIKKYGLTASRDRVFPWMYGESLATIAAFNKPLTRDDVQIVDNEMKNRRQDERDVVLIGNGAKTGLAAEIAKLQKRRNINKIHIIDIQQDGIITFNPAFADVEIIKKGKTAEVKIRNYISLSIMARLQLKTEDAFMKKIGDFRAQINYVLWDADYDGVCFGNTGGDCPQKKTEFIGGDYKISLPHANATIAVKIVDMLGEETLIIN